MEEDSYSATLPALQRFERTAETVQHKLELATRLSGNVAEMSRMVCDLRTQIAVMDHELDMFLADRHTNLEKFRIAVPMIERQLDRISKRMDGITDEVLHCDFQASGGDGAARRRELIGMLNEQNDSFNSMIVKLLSL